jgi:MraZ protein
VTAFDNFIQSSKVKIDPKNRLPVGSALKRDDDSSSDALMLTIGFDGCLYFMPADEWNDLMAKLKEKGATNSQALRFERTISAYATKVKPDAQWRIVVSPDLMDLAGFSSERRDASLTWVGGRLEVWEKSNLESYMSGQPYKLHPVVQTLKKAAEELTL